MFPPKAVPYVLRKMSTTRSDSSGSSNSMILEDKRDCKEAVYAKELASIDHQNDANSAAKQ